MGKNDIYMKKYLSDKQRFADLFNNVICHGETVFTAENMHEINNVSGLVLKDKNGKESSINRYRDIMMETINGEKLLLLAVENQEEIHYAMPVRGMLYDALNYMEQVQELSKRNRKQKKLNGNAEYLSGLQKYDKLNPVITLVFYYGNKPWDGSKDIYGLLNLKEQEVTELERFIPNYRINLVDVRELAQNSSFKSDLQWILGMLQYKDNKEQLRQYMNKHEEFFREIDENAYGAAKALLGNRMIPKVPAKSEAGGIDMCKALDDLYNDGVREGREQGIEQGIEQGMRLCLELLEREPNVDLKKALVDKQYRQKLYQEYGI